MIKALSRLALAAVLLFVLLQCIRPSIPTQPATAEIQAPPEIRPILETHCYACHSDQRRLSWFDQIVPGYWLVRHDILTARQHLNFSTLGAKPPAAQKGRTLRSRHHGPARSHASAPIPRPASRRPHDPRRPQHPQNLPRPLVESAESAQSRRVPAASANPAPPINLASVQPEPGGITPSIPPSKAGS